MLISLVVYHALSIIGRGTINWGHIQHGKLCFCPCRRVRIDSEYVSKRGELLCMCLFIIIILIVVNISLFSFPTHKHLPHVIWGRKLVVPWTWYDLSHIISIPSYILTWIIIIIIDIPLINGYLLLWMVVLLWFVVVVIVVEFG